MMVEKFSEGLTQRLIDLDSYILQHTCEQGLFSMEVGPKVFYMLIEAIANRPRYTGESPINGLLSLYLPSGEVSINCVKTHNKQIYPCRYCGSNKYNDNFECQSCGAKWR